MRLHSEPVIHGVIGLEARELSQFPIRHFISSNLGSVSWRDEGARVPEFVLVGAIHLLSLLQRELRACQGLFLTLQAGWLPEYVCFPYLWVLALFDLSIWSSLEALKLIVN